MKAASIVEVFPNSLLMNPTPGANILEARGEMKVIAEMRKRRLNFFPCGKLSGMAGSSCPSQPTTLSARFCSGMVIGGSRSLVVAMRESALDTLLPPVSVRESLVGVNSASDAFIDPCV